MLEPIERIRRRRNTIVELAHAIETEGFHGECDDCHNETRVILDPDTTDMGNFEYCHDCLAERFHRITDKLTA